MMMDVLPADLVRVVAALVIGGLIGGEREYRGKAAGFRTMTLICMGASVFTILSERLGTAGTHDRIASNIVTGIGFLGAGVIFKDGLSVSGLTTATSIWMTAALGMAAGAGELRLATVGLGLALVVLAVFQRLQDLIDNLHQKRSYRFQFSSERLSRLELERAMSGFPVSFALRRVVREDRTISCWYDVWGSQNKLQEFSEFFLNFADIRAMEF
jgi:putative Mg2+ transporter-C (MgtC) family protein